jgi:hypothetical protein
MTSPPDRRLLAAEIHATSSELQGLAYSDDGYRRKQSSGKPKPSPKKRMQAARQLFET